MRWITAIRLTAVWLREWLKLCMHYVETWEPPGTLARNREDCEDLIERMKSSPLKYEYERVQGLKHSAEDAWKTKDERLK